MARNKIKHRKEIKKKAKEAKVKGPRFHTQAGRYLPGKFIGKKFVRKANMTVVYTNYNKPGVADKQEWI